MGSVEHDPADREGLEQSLALLKREVDALQVQVMQEARPWYRQIPVLVSLVVSVSALAFSFWTDYRSQDRLDRQDEHAARAELRGLIQRLQALPKENFELYRTYSKDPNAQRALGPLVATENQVLGQQAAQLIEDLEGDVTTVEYYATAYAFASSGQMAEAQKLLAEGIKVADSAVTEVAVLRQDASVRFATGDVEGGRQRWQQALDIFEKYPQNTKWFIAQSNTETQMNWALAELAQGNCTEAWRHVTSAGEYVSVLGPEHVVTGQREEAERTVAEACGSKPDE